MKTDTFRARFDSAVEDYFFNLELIETTNKKIMGAKWELAKEIAADRARSLDETYDKMLSHSEPQKYLNRIQDAAQRAQYFNDKTNQNKVA